MYPVFPEANDWLKPWKLAALLLLEHVRNSRADSEIYFKSFTVAHLPIGMLPPLKEEKGSTGNAAQAFQWLEGQKWKSMLFVGFGSEGKMPQGQIHGQASSIEMTEMLLPPGLEERMANQGVVLLGWALQLGILSHRVNGGCPFHSGWSTIIESFGFGHPLILLPMVADQGLNAKLLVEKDVRYEVPRNQDHSFSKEVVAESIRRVLLGPEGENLSSKAAQMRGIFNNQQSQDSCIEHLQKYTGKIS